MTGEDDVAVVFAGSDFAEVEWECVDGVIDEAIVAEDGVVGPVARDDGLEFVEGHAGAFDAVGPDFGDGGESVGEEAPCAAEGVALEALDVDPEEIDGAEGLGEGFDDGVEGLGGDGDDPAVGVLVFGRLFGFEARAVVSEVDGAEFELDRSLAVGDGAVESDDALVEAVVLDVAVEEMEVGGFGFDGDGAFEFAHVEHADADDSVVGADVEDAAGAARGAESAFAEVAEGGFDEGSLVVSVAEDGAGDALVGEEEGEASLFGVGGDIFTKGFVEIPPQPSDFGSQPSGGLDRAGAPAVKTGRAHGGCVGLVRVFGRFLAAGSG